MRIQRLMLLAPIALAAIGCVQTDTVAPRQPAEPMATVAAPGVTAVANLYVADFIGSAATAVAMNDAGDVAGQSYVDPGCAPFCLARLETVAWRSGVRYVLPSVSGFPTSYVRGMNNSSWIVGLAGTPGSSTRALLWRPNATGYGVTDLGALPGTSIAEAVGVDNADRVVGWSRGLNFPSPTKPFLWTSTAGLVDLGAQGYPAERPEAISPGGTVATAGFWYRLGNPASATTVPAPPRGFYVQPYPTVINDNGDQARFLITTGSQNLLYPYRLPAGGTWQQLSSAPTGSLSRYGFGSINAAQDVTLTVQSTGAIAAGPSGLATSLAARVSPAYQGAAVTTGGPMNAAGHILAQVFIGRSPRLMKLVPAVPCTTNCARVSALTMTGVFVQDPRFPGQCFQGGNMYNNVTARLTVRTEAGAALGSAQVHGRFLDDYYLDKRVTGRTGPQGNIAFRTTTSCGVGAVAFLVDSVVAGARRLDRTTGILTNWVIPK
jgi:hypothetical protein